MILFDSVFINNGGGKILLNYLVNEFENSKIDVFYLFDERCINDFDCIHTNKKVFLKPSIFERFKFYFKNKNKFEKILCFGNIAPPIRTNSIVYTYFHQRIYLKIPDLFSRKQNLLFKLKTLAFKYFLRNTDYLILQTESIKDEFFNKIESIESDKVLVVPFYETINNLNLTKKKNSFLYVSSGSSHKNHELLLDAFKLFYDTYKVGELTITITKDYNSLFERIKNLNKLGYPIKNIEFVPKQKLNYFYSITEYVIYPSLSESFGLGILEGLETDCKIIGSDLPFLHAVCEPTLSFNPNSVSEIVECFRIAVNSETNNSKQKVFNEIDKLITLFKLKL